MAGTAFDRNWIASIALSLTAFFFYMANRAETTLIVDTAPNLFLPWILARGYGFDFEPLRRQYGNPAGAPPPYLFRSGKRLISVYPPGAALVGALFSIPQIFAGDLITPGWDRDGPGVYAGLERIGKRTSALTAALVVFFTHRLLILIGCGVWSTAAAAAVAFGSNLWVVASQATWQHGPAALCLILAAWLLTGSTLTRIHALLAGAATAMLVICRSIDLVFAIVLVAWLVRIHPRRASWFLTAPLIGGAALLWYNFTFFNALIGGQAVLEATHEEAHGVTGTISAHAWEGLLGTLVSPNRGLFIFSPWTIVLAPFLSTGLSSSANQSPARWLAAGLILFWFAVGSYSAWWAGHSFGPRYWTEATPLFAAPLAVALRSAWRRSRLLFAMLSMLIVWSISVQVVGAVCYPSSWNVDPENVDKRHERIWDWRDSELSRCLQEGPLGSRRPR